MFLICCGLICWHIVWAQAGVYIQQSSYLLQTPDPVTVSVNIQNVYADMRGYQVRFSFDTQYLEVSGTDAFHQGPFLSENGLTSWNVSGTGGEWTVGCAILGLTNGSVGSGNLFTVTLRPKKNTGPAGTDVQLSGVILRDILNNEIPVGLVGNCNIVIDAFNAFSNIKVFLQGPYLGAGQMRHSLTNYLPLISPYDGEALDALPDVSPHYIVDWMQMQLRTTTTGAAEQTINVFLLENGYLVSTNGTNNFPIDYIPGTQYYIVLRHRNHLGIMSSAMHTFSLTPGGATSIDLSALNSVYGGNTLGVKQIEPGVLALYAGDASFDGQIAPTDRNDYWKVQAGQSGYKSGDFDLDSNVFPNDRNEYWKLNVGRQTQIPF